MDNNLTSGSAVNEALLTLIADLCDVLLIEEINTEDRNKIIRAISRALKTGI